MQAWQGSRILDFQDEAEAVEEVALVFDSVEADQFFVVAYLVGCCWIRNVAGIVAKELGVGFVKEFELSNRGMTTVGGSFHFANLSVGVKVVGS